MAIVITPISALRKDELSMVSTSLQNYKKKKMEWSSIWKDVGTHRKCYYLLQKLAFYA